MRAPALSLLGGTLVALGSALGCGGVTSAAATTNARSGAPETPPAAALDALDAGDRAVLPPRVAQTPSSEGSPTEARLTTYRIDQAIDDVSGTFAARMTLTFENPTGAPLDRVPLLLHPNAPRELGQADSGAIELTTVTDESGAALAVEQKRATLALVSVPPIAAGARFTMKLAYVGKLRQLPTNANDPFAQAMSAMGSMSGSGASDYGLLATGDGILTFACAYPILAPFRAGAFDTSPPAKLGDLAYNAVARFDVRTLVPTGVTLVTNLVDAAPRELSPGTTLVESAGSFVRDFVLVAGRDLERQSVNVGAVRVTSVSRKRDAEGGKRALDTAASALASFERRFGPYPYTELDVAEASIVGGAGGVEFSGMVLVAGMLYRAPDDSQSPLATMMKLWGSIGGGLGAMDGVDQDGAAPADAAPSGGAPTTDPSAVLDGVLEFTVAHEVAHQWFAGLVGNDSHENPSLDEPAAQYLAGLAIEDLHGPEAAARAMDANVKMNYALYRLLGGVDRPVQRSTSSFRSGIEYAALVYGKAPYAYVALRKKHGDERLHAAMRSAIDAHRFDIVAPSAWIDALASSLGADVRPTFARWFEEAHGDADLGVDGDGEFVMNTMFPPEVAGSLREATATLGMKPGELVRMVFGGALGDDAPTGPGFDPAEVLGKLGRGE